MAFLSSVSDRFWNYVSPRKTQQRREKPFAFKKPAIPPARVKPLHRDIPQVSSRSSPPAQVVSLCEEATPLTRETSLKARVKTWDPRTPSPPSDMDIDMDVDMDMNVDVDATLLPPSPPASALQSEDFEGDTLVHNSPTALADAKEGSSADEWDANEEIRVVDDGTYMNLQKKISFDEERKRRDQQARELHEAGWSGDAVFLFQKLGMRGFEPILPIAWLNDFPSVPEDLFTEKLDKAFIKPAFGTDYGAQQALEKLFDLGGVVRDAWHTRASRTPAYQTSKAIKKYTKWAMKDGQVDHIWSELPLFQIVTFSRHVHPTLGEAKMIEKLGRLYELWHEALQIDEAESRGDAVIPAVPTLYGITASHSVFAFVSYAVPTEENEQPQLRLIAMFDFNKEGFDVWNSLAISIFVIHCRNRIMELRERLPELKVSDDEDPDL